MKTIIDTLEDVVEAFRGEYESKNGKYHLKMEGEIPGAAELAESKGKVIEFRDRNIKLLSGIALLAGVEKTEDLEPLKTKFAEHKVVTEKHKVVVEEHKKMKEQLEEIKKKGITKGDDVEEIVRKQIGIAVDPIRKQLETTETTLATEKTARAEAQKRADSALLREKIGTEATKIGAKANALGFLIGQAEESFVVKDEKVVARDSKFSVKKPAEPLEIEEWLEGAIKDYDFAFAPSQGGDPTPTNSGTGTPRPGVKQLVNPTPQELGKYSKEIAKREIQVVNK